MSAAEQTLKPVRVTPQEYLERERKAEYKSEYWDGEIVAMAGGSADHSLICVNIAAELRARLKQKPCRTYSSDLRVHATRTKYFYPDITVVCGEPQFTDGRTDGITNPTVIVEVLSPSTEETDRRNKFAWYRQVETLTDYIMVTQDPMLVEHYARQGSGQWLFTELRGPDALLRLPSIGCELPLSEIYARVTFPPAEEES